MFQTFRDISLGVCGLVLAACGVKWFVDNSSNDPAPANAPAANNNAPAPATPANPANPAPTASAPQQQPTQQPQQNNG